MPVRSRIHSSFVSTILEISSLVKTGSGTLMPQPVTCAYGIGTPWLFFPAADDQGRIMAAKPKGIGHNVHGIRLARLIGHVIQVTSRVGRGVINRGWQN